jgi:nucleosome assembly protein 1-like 1
MHLTPPPSPPSAPAQAKFAELGLDQDPEEFVNSLPPHIKRKIEALQELQKKRDEIEAQFRKERAELEAKYDKLYSE